jgi:hypothetical protein
MLHVDANDAVYRKNERCRKREGTITGMVLSIKQQELGSSAKIDVP